MEKQILQLVKNANPSNPLQYVQDIIKDYSIEKLNEHIKVCNDCEICKNNIKSYTKGKANATILIIGESVSEEQEGDRVYPFEDSAGDILNKVLDYYNINKEEIFYINAVNCWPNKVVNSNALSRTPNKKEVLNCKTFVEYAIKVVQPRLIITLGSIALNQIFNESLSMTNSRGTWKNYMGIPVMPTFHPGYFIKIQGKKDPEVIEEQKQEFLLDIGKSFLYIQENYPNDNLLQTKITL